MAGTVHGGECDECGAREFEAVGAHGARLLECVLCGALQGDETLVRSELLARQARDLGIDPSVFALVTAVGRIQGLSVADSDGGDPVQGRFPFVQIVPTDPDALRGIDNLCKSMALSSREHAVHWVIEAEFQNRLVFTLKPRFHSRVGEIDSERIRAAQADLGRICRHVERDMHLSWWH